MNSAKKLLKHLIKKQTLHSYLYFLQVCMICDLGRCLIESNYGFRFWFSFVMYFVLVIIRLIWENKDYTVRMYPYAEEDEDGFYEEDEEFNEGDENEPSNKQVITKTAEETCNHQ